VTSPARDDVAELCAWGRLLKSLRAWNIVSAMVDATGELERGREAFARRAWLDAYTALSNADRASALGDEDLELLAIASFMVGRMDEYLAILERAHHVCLEAGKGLRAARCAFWLGMNLAVQGDFARAGGWFSRGQRLVEREGQDCVEQGYFLIPVVLQREGAGDLEGAYETAASVVEIAERFRDPDLAAVALHELGSIRIKQGRIEDGLRLLDEAMVGVTAEQVSPVIAGVVYCGVIASCEDAFEARRAREWTNALARWCEEQPQLVSFTGRCLAHRAGILQRHGDWRDALEEARLARERCEQAMNRAATGQALYQQGELHRLQGDLAAAEAAYRDASSFGREPQPGLALLRLAEGDVDAAAAAIRRVVGEAKEPLRRAVHLPAYAEIMVAAGEADDARRAGDELREIAAGSGRPMLEAIAASVQGAVELAGGDAEAALTPLRQASELWHELDAPYEVARVRVLIGLACGTLGDRESSSLELEAARVVFEALGAAPDLARLDSLAGEAEETYGLSARELEVLRHVAAGKTNREIASELVVSEHTVARHMQNIRAKLGVSSRTAAAAFAFEHKLV
jgi:ATP/maltotriose-dependent transcriptional regulator MalT